MTSNDLLQSVFVELDPFLSTYDIAMKHDYCHRIVIAVFEQLYPELLETIRRLPYRIKKKPEIHYHEEYFVNQEQVDAILVVLRKDYMQVK